MWFRRTVKTAALTTTLLAGAFVWAVPRQPLPEPPGPYEIATRTVVVGPSERRLPVQVWYPTAAEKGPRAAVIPGASRIAEALADETVLPAFALRPIGLQRGNAVLDGPAAEGEWPVVLLVHGWLGMRWVHTDLAEALASRGHVVIAADHVGGAIAATFPDGEVVLLDDALLPPEGTPDYWQRADALVNLFAGDLLVMLDELPQVLQAAGIGATGFDAVPAIGHSTGGGAAVRAAQLDDRIAGIVGMDPWVEPLTRLDSGALRGVVANDVPLHAIRSEAWVGNSNDQILREMDHVRFGTVDDSSHRDFTAIGWLSPVVRLVNVVDSHPLPVYRRTLDTFATLQQELSATQ